MFYRANLEIVKSWWFELRYWCVACRLDGNWLNVVVYLTLRLSLHILNVITLEIWWWVKSWFINGKWTVSSEILRHIFIAGYLGWPDYLCQAWLRLAEQITGNWLPLSVEQGLQILEFPQILANLLGCQRLLSDVDAICQVQRQKLVEMCLRLGPNFSRLLLNTAKLLTHRASSIATTILIRKLRIPVIRRFHFTCFLNLVWSSINILLIFFIVKILVQEIDYLCCCTHVLLFFFFQCFQNLQNLIVLVLQLILLGF